MTTSTFGPRFVANAEAALKSGSTWVVGLIGVAALYYSSLSDAQQTALLASIPFLKGQAAVVSALALYLVARFKPSNATTTQTQALLNEIARLKANEYLALHGAPPIPAPAVPVVVAPAALAAAIVKAAPATDVDIPFPGEDPRLTRFRQHMRLANQGATEDQVLAAYRVIYP